MGSAASIPVFSWLFDGFPERGTLWAHVVTLQASIRLDTDMDGPTSTRIEDLIRERLRLDQELDRYQQLLTILYVDIVGSTRFYDEHGNTAGLVMVQKCLDLLIPVVEQHRGIVVKTIGDAILARFDSVEDSIRAAMQMVRSLEQRNRGRSRTDEIHVHVGINYGLCLQKDNDVFGDVVNVAARIEAQAAVDEIVISPSAYEQVRHLGDLRVRKKADGVELKGKASKLDLYSVLWKAEESVGAAPPPPSADQLVMSTGLHANFAEMAARRIARAQAPPAPPVFVTAPTVGRSSVSFSLACVRPDGTFDQRRVLDRPGITAGQRGDIALAGDPLVAPHHVRFTQLGDQVFVEDLGSARGVYLRVRVPHHLENDDVFQIGEQLMRFMLQPNPSTLRMPGAGPTGERPQAFLVRLNSNEQEINRWELGETEMVFGRSKGTYTFADDPYLSSTHARVIRRDDKYFLEDVGSRNGTFFKIRKRAFVREGDTILIGRQLLRLLVNS